MRTIDIIRQKRRFEMFSKKTREKVLELNAFFGKYNMAFEEKIQKVFTYYDTPNMDLQKSNIALFKTQIGNFTELNMATEKINNTYQYKVRTNYKHFIKQIKSTDKILKHKDFLIDSFKGMFMSSINFDPEFLLQKLQIAYVIKTISWEYRSVNPSGLKITYSFDEDIYTNMYNNQAVSTNILTIYQHSKPDTDEAFDDLVGKLTRYLKELIPTSDTKIMYARKLTVTKASPIIVKIDDKKNDSKKDKKPTGKAASKK